ncbi:hypothetical protein D9758_018147 [Tetrapyrgos nigripes]|uniref:WD40 repeat-like protein n=1 Tax=Tetrapyrgos nigripes TaxID=182062 RepID=A0A8H5BC80_9AGAR|nr:hypothetical protein D9758_018147 [Tetrapyrgos nigripes]
MLWRNPYKKLATLSGPQNAILSVSFSVDGTFVSAAGYGGVTIWNLETGQAVPTPRLPYAPFEKKHVYSSSVWLFFEENEKHVIMFGNMTGQVTVWYWDGHLRQMFRVSESQAVYCNDPEQVMSMDVLQGRVPANKDAFFVTSTNDNSVSVWKLNSELILSNVFQANLPPAFIPQTVQFSEASCSIITFSKTGGIFLQLNSSTGEPVWIRKEGPKCMDSVALDERRDIFAAWTGEHAAVFRLSNAEHITTFPNEGRNVGDIKQIAFAEDGSTLVFGTDYGSAEIFSLDSRKCVQSLSYPGGPLVQSIAMDSHPSFFLSRRYRRFYEMATSAGDRFHEKYVHFPSRRSSLNSLHGFQFFQCGLIYYTPSLSQYLRTSENSNALDAPAAYANLPATVTVTERELVTHIVFEVVPVTFTFKLESYMTPVTSNTRSDVDELTTMALD